CRPAYRQFQQASESPHDTQRLLLNDILHLSSATEYGQSLSIKTTDSYEEFCKKVSLQNYDVHLAPWILKQQQESTKNIFCAGGASH
ncbi:GH3 auxin-responsive promoter family protein, partial [Pseudomonas sp. FW305-20]|uniref:GH3 family domain-containing protein n=1 Tax=Pseudomonas sp. FW305-20 TaxID=2070560 RepID=UPI0011AFA60D